MELVNARLEMFESVKDVTVQYPMDDINDMVTL